MNMFKTKEDEKNIDGGNGKEFAENESIYPGRETKSYHDFFSEQMACDPLYEVRLYKIPDNRKETMELLDVYAGKCPHERDIGYEHGGGLYRAHGRRPGQRNPDVRIINLAPIWTQRKRERDAQNMQGTPMLNNLESSLNILERLGTVVTKLSGNNGSNNGNGSLGPVISEVKALQIELLRDSIKDRKQLLDEFKDITSTAMTTEPQRLPDDNQGAAGFWDHPMVNEIMEAIVTYGKKWLGADDKTKSKYRETMAKNPAFQEIIKDEDKILALYNKGCQNEKIGKEMMDKLFADIGIKVTEEPEANQEPQTNN